MKKLTILTMIGTALLAGALNACSKGSSARESRSEQGQPDAGTEAPPAASYDINVTQLDGGACPDVANFFAQLKALPSQALVRRHTVRFQPNAKNEDGTRPRANFLTVLAFSSFEISERGAEEIRADLTSVEQNGCQNVRFNDPGAGFRDFVVRSATSSSITLGQIADPANPSVDAMTMTFEWTSPREARIESTYLAMDFCADYKPVRVERTQVMRWGPADEINALETENVDALYLDRAVKALTSVPKGLSTSEVVISDNSGNAQIPVADLRKLRDSQLRTDMKVCPYRAKPPVGDEPPPPEPDASPTPTPAPDTGMETPEPEET